LHWGMDFNPAADLSGLRVHVLLKVGSGSGPGVVQVFSQSGGFSGWTADGWTHLSNLTDWTELTLDLVEVGEYDPTSVNRIGIEINANDNFEDLATNVIDIDAIWFTRIE